MAVAVFQTLLIALISHFVYYSNERDILAPACIACFVSLLCSAASIYDCWAWSYEIGIGTLFVFVGGLLCFAVPATFFSMRNRTSGQLSVQRVTVPHYVTAGVILFGLVASYLYVHAISQVAGGGDWSQTMQSYRNVVSYGDSDEQIPSSISRLFRLFMAFGYAYMFLFINELVTTNRVRFEYILPGLMYCIVSLAQAARGQIIAFLFAGTLVYWIVKRQHNERITVKFSTVTLIVVALVCGLALFASTNELVGRSTVKTPLDSLMTYVGGSIIGLDMFLKDPSMNGSANIFGYETFRGLYAFIGRTFDVPEFVYSFQLEYRFAGMVNVGNLYSAYRYYMNDFGVIGVVLFPAIQGALFGGMYRRLITRSYEGSQWRFAAEALSFSYVALSVAYLPIADYFFHQYLNPTTLLTLLMLAATVWLLFKMSLKNARERCNLPIKHKHRWKLAR